MAEQLTCYLHPNTPTNLRCSKCGRPICTKCVIETPVGLRCRECAQLRRIPTYVVSPLQYVTASAAAIGLALLTGIGWAFLQGLPMVRFLSFFIALGVGYIMGEVVSLSVNRKGGAGLKIIAGVGVLLSYLLSRTPVLALLVMPSVAVAGMINALLNPFSLLTIGIAIYIAVNRIR